MKEDGNFARSRDHVPEIPREVYNRCLWLIRDMDRIENIISMRPARKLCSAGTYGNEDDEWTLVNEDVVSRALEDYRCYERALESVPEVYREGIIDNICNKVPFSETAHINTWKKWKKSFIINLAREMHLI